MRHPLFSRFQSGSFLLLLLPLLFGGCFQGNSQTEETPEEEMVTIELGAPITSDAPAETTETKTARNVTTRPETDVSLPENQNFQSTQSPQTSQKSHTSKKQNVILMIADGAGFGSFYCAADFLTGAPTGFFWQNAPWKQTSVATFHKKSFYDPEKDWADFKNLRVPFYQKEPAFIPPDSASTGTAMMTGVKTRNGRVGVGPDDEILETIAEIFHRNGRRTGAVTTYQIASATMADVASHELERKNGQKMFAQMLLDGNLDVIIGAGHPEFNDDAQPQAASFGKYGPGPELWAQIRDGKLPAGWLFIEKRTDFQKLADALPGTAGFRQLPPKLLGIAQTANAFQCLRQAGSPLLPQTPTLAEASLAALNVLTAHTNSPKAPGFFLMIEGGAVDCANDANDLERCVEEMADFHAAIEAVCLWVEKNSSWEETLLIITADHDNGAIYGPENGSDGVPLTAPLYRGKGVLADVRYYSDDHTKQLVPLYARGPGAEEVEGCVIGTDERMGKFWNYDGRFIENTSVFRAMMSGLPFAN